MEPTEGIQLLLGKTITEIQNTGDQLHFLTSDGTMYRMLHYQSCCECVYIEDICGDLDDLVGSPILQAEEVCSYENPADYNSDGYVPVSFTWTFYKLATLKGYVTIRWYGSSNGYYSESVDFVEVGGTVEPADEIDIDW